MANKVLFDITIAFGCNCPNIELGHLVVFSSFVIENITVFLANKQNC